MNRHRLIRITVYLLLWILQCCSLAEAENTAIENISENMPAVDCSEPEVPAAEQLLPDTPACESEECMEISAYDVAVFDPEIFGAGRPELDRNTPIPQKELPPDGGIKAFESSNNPFYERDSSSERSLNISGTKTFEMKKADVKGDVGHFSTDNYDSIPGFRLDQSLHLEVEGNITRNARVFAVLDDKEDEDRRFTVNIDGPVWNFTMGDFPLFLDGVEFALNRKEVRGILAQGSFHPKFRSIFMFSQSKGAARREQFRGAGQQQEFRLTGSPVVQNSERVSIDGRLLTRGSDYLIDYEDGILKFQAHVLPIEITRWIVVEYEISDKKLSFKRNLMGTRQIYLRDESRRIGVTWLREVDGTTPRGETELASATLRPMQHDIIGMDTVWKINRNITFEGESALSVVDQNRNSDETDLDKDIRGRADKLSLKILNERLSGDLAFRRIEKDFRLVGRDEGVLELGERGLVNDLMKSNAKLSYALKSDLNLFGTFERSRTNLSGAPELSKVHYDETLGGAAWRYAPKSQLEMRYGVQSDLEKLDQKVSDLDKKSGTAVWDHQFGNLFTQTRLEHITYEDAVNTASGSRVLQAELSFGSEYRKFLTWNFGLSRVRLDDDYDPDQLRSDIQNYTLDMNYEPNRVLQARGIFQFRREEDYLVNSRQDDQIADSRFQYQPNRDLRTQFKYKVENTSKIIRDDTLDPTLYVNPPSLPLETNDEDEIISRFENPVRKTTANFTTTYHLRHNLETYFDWRWRDVKDRSTSNMVSENDRKTYEIRYTPMKKLQISTDYEEGFVKNHTPASEIRDNIKRVQLRNEFYEGYIFDLKFEKQDEDDIYNIENDRITWRKSLDFQRVFSRMATLELGIQRNTIEAIQFSKEWEQRASFIITPSARNQRYKLFINRTEIESAQPGCKLEGGVNFSQFIGTDTIIDGEIKKVKADAGTNGNGYDALVANAKMVISF